MDQVKRGQTGVLIALAVLVVAIIGLLIYRRKMANQRARAKTLTQVVSSEEDKT